LKPLTYPFGETTEEESLRRFALCFVVLPALLLAGTVGYTAEFSSNDLRLSKAGGFDKVELRWGTYSSQPGAPLVPERTVYLLVPPDCEVTGISVRPEETVDLPGEYNLYPAQEPRTLSISTPPAFVPQDAAIYGSRNPYPEAALSYWSAGIKSGFQLCGVTFSPVQYVPGEHRLSLSRRVQIDVDYSPGAKTALPLTGSQVELFGTDVAELVSNPEDLKRFAPSVQETDEYEIDYLVISNAELSSNLQPFCDWKTSKGVRTEVRTTQWITTHYAGRDAPEKMRNLVIDYYQHRGLKYLLLAGDVQVAPCRLGRAIVGGEVGNIPCDMYFADLQGSWDGNRNDIFGEAGVDSVDVFADIYVGRSALDNAEHCATLLAKVKTYESNPDPAFIKKMLLPSGWLWQSENYHGHIVNDAIAEYTPGDWEDASLIDPVNANVTRDSVNAGFGFCHLAGHGNQTGVYSENGSALYTTGQAYTQQNSLRDLIIMNSMACDPGDFEYNECLTEIVVNNPHGGAICAMMNSRYGWGTPPVMGPSELLDLRFYDQYFNYDSTDIGIDHARSKDYYRNQATHDDLWRYCVYELNLLGDPQLPLWHDVPGAIQATFPDSVHTGQDTIAVHVESGGAPLANALVCAWRADEVFARARTDGAGNARLPTSIALPGMLSLVVTAPEHLPFRDSLVVLPGGQMAYVAYGSYAVDDAGQTNPNGVLEPMETVNLTVALRNLGNLDAQNVNATLRGLSGFVQLLDSVSSYGTVAAGGMAAGDGFRLTARNNVPQNALLDFTLEVTSDQGNWTIPFWVYVGYHGLSVADVDSFAGLLSVTAMGALGYDGQPSSGGRGFRYPASDTSRLYLGSFVFGTAADYLVDNYYGQPFTTLDRDWRLQDSLRYVIPRWGGNEHVVGAFSDAGFASPRNVQVRQQSIAVKQPGFSDFAIMVYDVTNAGATNLDQTFAGLFCDFDVKPTDMLHDFARTNLGKRAAYMWSALSEYPVVGVRLLSSYPLSNATVVDPACYKYPDSAMSKSMKFRMLNGAITQSATDHTADWSLAVATGPIELSSGMTRRVAFAVVGGTDSLSFLANCDSAQSWYDAHVGIEERGSATQAKQPVFSVMPNPCAGPLNVSYQVRRSGRVTIELFDASGRKTATLLDQVLPAGTGRLAWDSRGVSKGVYFLRLAADGEVFGSKLLLVN
jgi:hypothetical protein